MNPGSALIVEPVLSNRYHKPSIVPQGGGSLALGKPAEAVATGAAVVLCACKTSNEP